MTVGLISGLLFAARDALLKGPAEIPADEQIEFAVIVVVEEARARAPARRRYACLGGHILERAVAPVPVQHIAAIGRQIQIFKAVVIEVADGDPHRVTRSGAR